MANFVAKVVVTARFKVRVRIRTGVRVRLRLHKSVPFPSHLHCIGSLLIRYKSVPFLSRLHCSGTVSEQCRCKSVPLS